MIGRWWRAYRRSAYVRHKLAFLAHLRDTGQTVTEHNWKNAKEHAEADALKRWPR